MQGQTGWQRRFATAAQALFGSAGDHEGSTGAYNGAPLWQRLFGQSPEIVEVDHEVAAEQRGRVVLVAHSHHLCRLLLAALRGQEPTPPFRSTTSEGIFTLVDLSTLGEPMTAVEDSLGAELVSGIRQEADSFGNAFDLTALLAAELADADLLLYLFDGDSTGPLRQSSDAHWVSRLRALGVAMLPVAIVPDAIDSAAHAAEPAGCAAQQESALRTQLGVAPVRVPMRALTASNSGAAGAAHDAALAALAALVDRMLALRPKLGLLCAQEFPFCRRMIAGRVVRTGALIAALAGAEPLPLLDLPLHVAVQWKVAIQVASIYGRPGLDVRSREMIGAVALSLIVRTCAQQAIKLLPIVGWLLSGALSAVSALLLGHSLIRFYEEDQLPGRRAVRRALAGVLSSASRSVSLGRLRRKGASAAGPQTEIGADDADQMQEIPVRPQAPPESSACLDAACLDADTL